MAKVTFDALLKKFVSLTNGSMEAAQELANMSIRQFEEHGSLSYAQAFVDAMPRNYIRREAYLSWLGTYSPLTVGGSAKDGYNLSKDKGDEATDFNIGVAEAISFWEFKPIQEDVTFGSTDVVKALRGVIRKFGKDRYKAASNQATLAVASAKNMVDELEAQLKHDNSNEAPSVETILGTPAVEPEPMEATV